MSGLEDRELLCEWDEAFQVEGVAVVAMIVRFFAAVTEETC